MKLPGLSTIGILSGLPPAVRSGVAVGRDRPAFGAGFTAAGFVKKCVQRLKSSIERSGDNRDSGQPRGMRADDFDGKKDGGEAA